MCYAGPRAGFNLLDGYGGGSELAAKFGFAMVRETSDHGFFNSWSRIVSLPVAHIPKVTGAQNLVKPIFIHGCGSLHQTCGSGVSAAWYRAKPENAHLPTRHLVS